MHSFCLPCLCPVSQKCVHWHDPTTFITCNGSGLEYTDCLPRVFFRCCLCRSGEFPACGKSIQAIIPCLDYSGCQFGPKQQVWSCDRHDETLALNQKLKRIVCHKRFADKALAIAPRRRALDWPDPVETTHLRGTRASTACPAGKRHHCLHRWCAYVGPGPRMRLQCQNLCMCPS